jgi:hypothetical protein
MPAFQARLALSSTACTLFHSTQPFLPFAPSLSTPLSGFESTGKADVYDDRIFALSALLSQVLVLCFIHQQIHQQDSDHCRVLLCR